MNISPTPFAAPRAAQLLDLRPVDGASPAPVGVRAAVSPATDRLELSDHGHREDHDAARVAKFADKVSHRLANLASTLDSETRAGLADVQARFDDQVARIQDALASGELDHRGLKQAFATAMDGLRSDLADTLGIQAQGDGRSLGDLRVRGAEDGHDEGHDDDHGAERVEALAASVTERIQSLAQSLGDAVAEGLEMALAQFQDNVSRVLSAIQEGLGASGLASGVQNVLGQVRQDVQRGLGLESAGGPAIQGADGTPVRALGQGVGDVPGPGAVERFDSFTAAVDSRLSALDTSNLSIDELVSLRSAQAEFDSSMARLENAFFDQGTLDRVRFMDLFSTLFQDLKDQLHTIFGTEDALGSVSLYDSTSGVQALDAGSQGTLDRLG